MQVSTTLFYDRAVSRMTSLNTAAAKLNTQIATGKKITAPSQDIAAAQQIAEFDRKEADAAVYATNLNLSASLLQQAGTALGSVGEQMGRALELATRAGTGTMGEANRKVIGNELSAIVDSLVALGNTTDLRGQPLFGSAAGTAAVVRNADGGFTYNAAPSLSPIPIGDGLTVQATETAARIFTSDKGDALAMLASLATALQSGSDASGQARESLDSITAASDQVGALEASVGARAARVDLQQTLQQSAKLDRAELRSSIEDADPYESYTELQKTLTILQATQASFSKLSQLSLFDYLR